MERVLSRLTKMAPLGAALALLAALPVGAFAQGAPKAAAPKAAANPAANAAPAGPSLLPGSNNREPINIAADKLSDDGIW